MLWQRGGPKLECASDFGGTRDGWIKVSRQLDGVTLMHQLPIVDSTAASTPPIQLSRIAAARVHPAEAACTFTRKHTIRKPSEGGASRLQWSFRAWVAVAWPGPR